MHVLYSEESDCILGPTQNTSGYIKDTFRIHEIHTHIDDENHIGDTGEASSRTGKKASPKKSPKSPKSKAKGKKQKAVEEPTVEEEVPAKRQRRTRAQA